MMGMSTMPSAQSLTDLMTLLQLLQAASDPKKSKAAIETLQAERKVYDDAIAASVEAERKASVVIANAAAAVDKATAAQSAAIAEMASLSKAREQDEAIRAGFAERSAALVVANDNLDAGEADLAKRHVALMAREKAHAEDFAAKLSDIAEYQKKAQANMDEALALKAEYEAKLAKIKALTE